MKSVVVGKVLAKYKVGNKEVAMVQQGDAEPFQVKNVNGNAIVGEEAELYCKISINPGGYGKQPSIDVYCLEQ